MSEDRIFNPLEVVGYDAKRDRGDDFARLCVKQIEEAIEEINQKYPGSGARLLSFEITSVNGEMTPP